MRQQRGVTLIELMIVLVVVAILTAIAYPSYTSQVLKSRRADGIAALNRVAMMMESCRSDTATYVGCAVPANSEDGYYTIAAAATITATAYSFIATPAGGQAKDTKCTTLTLDSRGNRGFTGTAPNADTCWGQ
jgi:type IV pilus assembly protein PilE